MPEPKLTERQQSFVNLYALGTYSARDAYIKAGYSAKTADQAASRTLRIVKIQDAIAIRKQQLASTADSPQHALSPELVTRGLLSEAGLVAPRGDSTSASRVSALRTLADILGMTQGQAAQLPQVLGSFLEAVRAGHALASSQQSETLEARMLEEPAREAGAGTA